MDNIASRLVKRRKLAQEMQIYPNPSMTKPETTTSRCRLLELPLELQLSIYELVVIEEEPLLVNCPCNSSYRGRYVTMSSDESDWESGIRHPPLQPALAQTCRAIRVETLPIFYGENVFRASYCTNTTMLPPVLRWLRMIGESNRENLKHFYFYDRNQYQDRNVKSALEGMKASALENELGGRLETMSSDYCCAHLVTFGEWQRKEGKVPPALEHGVPRLRLKGEI